MRRKELVANLLLLVGSISIAIICAEVALRVLHPQKLGVWHETRDGIVILRPNLKRYATKFGPEFQINSIGMRDREHTVEKEDGTFRILLLGDSFMEAFQVDFERSFPRLLEQRLQESMTQTVEVINAAVSGWGSDDQLTYLKRYGVKFKPDLILVAMTLNNDVSDNMAEKFHTIVDGQLVERPIRETSFVDYMIMQMKSYGATHSHLYQLIRKYWHLRDIQKEAQLLPNHMLDLISSNYKPQLIIGWKLTYHLLKGIQAIGRQLGAETVIFLIPFSMQLSDDVLAKFLTIHDDISFQKPHEMMKEFGKMQKIEIIDLLPYLKEWGERNRRKLYLEFDGHWNQYGHRAAADSVAQELVRRELAKPRK